MKKLLQKLRNLFRRKKKLPLFECDYVVGFDPGDRDKTVRIIQMKRPDTLTHGPHQR